MHDATAGHETGHTPGEEPQESLPTLSTVERRYIERVLAEVRWNQRKAAKILGISRWALGRRLRKYALHPVGHDPGA